MPTDREALDQIQADMAGHQQEHANVEVTAEQNRRMAADLCQQIDREEADASPPPAASPVSPPEPDLPRTRERREIDGKGYVVTKGGSVSPILRKASPAEQWFATHAQPRIDLLLTKKESGPLGAPSWHDRVHAVLYFGIRVNAAREAGRLDLVPELERRYMYEMVELLEASSTVFGDWKGDAPTRATVSG